MANVSLDDIITALAGLYESSHSALTGRVHTRRRLKLLADPIPELVQMLTSLNTDKRAQGIIIQHSEAPASRDGACIVHRDETFDSVLIYPYQDDEGGTESATTFREIYTSARDVLDAKANLQLGLGSTVLADPVQIRGVYEDRYKVGEDARLVHVCLQTIRVKNSVVL